MKKDSKIYVAGHTGLFGSAIVRELKIQGYTNIILRSRSELDLMDSKQVKEFFLQERPEYIFDCAAKVGGIQANYTKPAEFLYENIQIQNNLIHNSYLAGAKKFLFAGSVCVYPKYAQTPIKEESFLEGYLEPTNEAYSVAKIAGIKMCQAYSKQYGLKTISVMPPNLFGPNDNFDPNSSHVIPSMFTKFSKAESEITFWGDGSNRREFLYSQDAANACIFLMNSDVEKGELINIGTGNDISIKDLAEIIANIFKFTGKINWDTSKPKGAPSRSIDCTKISLLGWKIDHNLIDRLNKTYNWYIENKQRY